MTPAGGGIGFAAASLASSGAVLAAVLILRKSNWDGWALVALAAVAAGLLTGGIAVARSSGGGRMFASFAFILNFCVGAVLLWWLARVISGSQ